MKRKADEGYIAKTNGKETYCLTEKDVSGQA